MQWVLQIFSLAIICSAVRAEMACGPRCSCNGTWLSCAGASPAAHLRRADLTAAGAALRGFSWTDSNFTALERDIFTGLHNLEDVDLSSNQIESIEHGLFSRLVRLARLNISYNRIDDIPRFTFADLENLEVLDLSHNRLQAIPFQVFGPVSRLQHLDISHNQIAAFLDYFFHPNRHLKRLFLNNNKLVEITSNALANLRELEILDLSSNKLDYIPKIFDSLDQLTTLNLCHNPYKNISNEAFKNLKNLEWLDIGGNRLQALPPALFQYNGRLKTIYLEQTDISVIQNTNFKGLDNLKRLYIRNNTFLKEIEPLVFQDTPSITHLDISSNWLFFLPLSLKMLDNLQELRINDNPWACDCRMVWFASWADGRKDIFKSDLSCAYSYPNDMLMVLNHTNCSLLMA